MLLAKLRLDESLHDLIVRIQSMPVHVEDNLAMSDNQDGREGKQWKGDQSIVEFDFR